MQYKLKPFWPRLLQIGQNTPVQLRILEHVALTSVVASLAIKIYV